MSMLYANSEHRVLVMYVVLLYKMGGKVKAFIYKDTWILIREYSEGMIWMS